MRFVGITVALFLAGCSGSIVIGNDRGDGGPSLGPDAGRPLDGGGLPIDTGLVDAGPPADTGPRPDGGGLPACTPGFPTSWPYPMTAAAYKTKFWSGLIQVQAQCTLAGACHGMGAPNPPSIPAMMTEVDANYAALIQQLWSRAQGGLPNAVLSTHHKPGMSQIHTYTAEEQAYVDGFLRGAAMCNGCSGGTCTCAAPAACTTP
jgi:hypothetical protein